MIRIATQKDLDGIASLHVKCFSEYFLTKLGLNLLAKYYSEFITMNDISLVYIGENDNVEGLLIGTSSSIGRDNFIKHNFIALGFRILYLCAKFDKDTWKRVLAYTKNKLKKRKRVTNSNYCNDNSRKEMRLLSICVSDKCKGKNVAKSLIEEFEKKLKFSGYSSYALTVYKSNIRANNFYKKIGMHVSNETVSEYEYRKIL